MLITFEGIEGSGKGVQIRLAEAHLKSKSFPCVVTREPGGTEFGVAVRQVLLGKSGARREPLSELLLYLADRYQHLKEVVEPSLSRGCIVLCDRYHDATRAYQGSARGIPLPVIDRLAGTLGIPEPDGTILLDLEVEVGLRRARSRNLADRALEQESRFEEEEISFHRAVRSAYLELAGRWPQRIEVVAASGSPEEVFARVRPVLDRWVSRMRPCG